MLDKWRPAVSKVRRTISMKITMEDINVSNVAVVLKIIESVRGRELMR